MKRRLAFLVLTLMTASCALAQKGYNMVFIGNSITYGALHEHPEKSAPPVMAATWIESQPGTGAVHCLNMGKSGRTSFDFLPGNKEKGFFDELILKTDRLQNDFPGCQLVFSIMLGTNDSAERPTNSRTTVYKYHCNMTDIVETLLQRYPDAKVFLHRPIYFSVPFVTKNLSEQSVSAPKLQKRYFKSLKKICAELGDKYPGHIFIGDSKAYSYFKKNHETLFFKENGTGCTFYLHPNEEGAKELAGFWGRAIVGQL